MEFRVVGVEREVGSSAGGEIKATDVRKVGPWESWTCERELERELSSKEAWVQMRGWRR